MYYTVGGKKFLVILYLIGLTVGSIVMNVMISVDWFNETDLFQFMIYLRAWESISSASLFFYVLLVRVKQLVFFFLAFLVISPYVVFCGLDFLFSVMTGGYFSCALLNYGVRGFWKGILIFMPHGIFYFLFFAILYIYLFQKNSTVATIGIREMWRQPQWSRAYKYQQLLNYKMITAILLIGLFLGGCYVEARFNPWILKYLA